MPASNCKVPRRKRPSPGNSNHPENYNQANLSRTKHVPQGQLRELSLVCAQIVLFLQQVVAVVDEHRHDRAVVFLHPQPVRVVRERDNGTAGMLNLDQPVDIVAGLRLKC